jgi:hypothetical protein
MMMLSCRQCDAAAHNVNGGPVCFAPGKQIVDSAGLADRQHGASLAIGAP